MNYKELENEISINGTISRSQAEWVLTHHDREAVYALSHQVFINYAEQDFEFCSIVNAKSGRCSEDCKWCAQSAHYKTDVKSTPIISTSECLEHAQAINKAEIKRFSLDTSGRKPNENELQKLCENIKAIKQKTGLMICASMGLLKLNEMQQLKEAGVERYHCNLETSARYFNSLCSSHTQSSKLETIKAARDAGLDICCGGIIGMGETNKDLIELAFQLNEVKSNSIPINILQPIKGTPLENTPPLTSTKILDIMALMRLVNPYARIRFAAGRRILTAEQQLKGQYIGVNSAIVGGLLTTQGTIINEDKKLFLNK